MIERKGKIYLFCWLLILGGFFYYPNSGLAASDNVLINEIAWMGNDNSTNDEWIELKNSTDQDIDLTGWILIANDDSPNISLEGIIPAQGFFLLERTDDNSVPDVTANQIYTGALSNTGEKLELKNNQGDLIDSIDASEGWPAGDNETKQTIERIDTGWQTSADPYGTPKAVNSDGEEAASKNEQTEDDSEQTQDNTEDSTSSSVNLAPFAVIGPDVVALVNQELFFDSSESYDPNNDELTYFWNFGDGATDTLTNPTHVYLYPGQYIVSLLVSDGEFSDLDLITVNIYSPSVIISEFLPNPQNEDTESEWIELYNQSDKIANLSGWQIDNQEDGNSPFVFPANSFIGPKQFLVLRQSITKLSFNNNNDQLRLIYPDGSIGSEVSYLAEEKQGFCIAFDGIDYFWTKIPTPGSANIISATGFENEPDYSTNNPKPIVQETKESTEILARNSQTENFDVRESSTSSTQFLETKSQTPQNNPQDIQAAALSQKLPNQKNKLILYFSIIISASLLVSWAVIQVKKI